MDVQKREHGFVTVQWIMGIAFTMFAFVVLVNFIMVYMTTGVVRSALDQAVRNGSRGAAISSTNIVEHCDNKVREAFGPPDGLSVDQVQLETRSNGLVCSFDPATRRLTATVIYCPQAWLPSLNTTDCGGVRAITHVRLSSSFRAEYAE